MSHAQSPGIQINDAIDNVPLEKLSTSSLHRPPQIAVSDTQSAAISSNTHLSPTSPISPHYYHQQHAQLKTSGTALSIGVPLGPTTTAQQHLADPLAHPEARRSHEMRLHDELEMLRTEQMISSREQELQRIGSRQPTSDDDDAHYNPNSDAILSSVKPPPQATPDSSAILYRLWIWLKKFPRIFRYIFYAAPGAAILLIPVLIGKYAFKAEDHAVGGDDGVYLEWFGIWLEIMWGSLWLSRMVTSLMPYIFKAVASMMGSVNSKKWKDIGRDLELHTALFLWMLAILVSTKTILENHRVPTTTEEDREELDWVKVVIRVIISTFVLSCLNLLEKIGIQWIAGSFHQRTYAVRIAQNKDDVSKLVRLYEHSKIHFHPMDSIWQPVNSRTNSSGYRAPLHAMRQNARAAWDKFGNVAGRIGNDFMGRKANSNHPRKVVGELLRSAYHSRALARILYRSLKGLHSHSMETIGADKNISNEPTNDDTIHDGDAQNSVHEKSSIPQEFPNFDDMEQLVYLEDFKVVFSDEEEAEAAFAIFDKDMNGDISMEEFEGVCYEIHLEKKAIAASLKDLDSVINKLDRVLVGIVLIISILVFVSIISGSAAAALTSAGTTILGLSWLLQATTQEFLQSLVFVFVKHPFDVGDRVTVYGNSGNLGRGDDYYVTEISLWYTEFKKMEGHIVQAPNSILNTLFILNQRRSNALADVVSLQVRFGTTQPQIEELKERMMVFVDSNRRDYQARILTEVRTLDDMQSATVNFIFFHKSNFQNELLRLSRHNRFLTELMQQMCEVGIQPPFKNQPGGSAENPVYWKYTNNNGTHEPPPFARDDDNASVHRAPRQTENGSQNPVPSNNHAEHFIQETNQQNTSDSRSATERLPALRHNVPFDDFQDVYSMRKDEYPPNRWNSVSGANASHLRMRRGTGAEVSSLSQQESHQTGSMHPRLSLEQNSTHEPGIRRMTTTMSKMSSTSRRFWHRPRARTQSDNRPMDVLPDGSLV
ncbi:hypothetical protein Cpir12675_006856 [Ceratocystis pirilliformis]|uniref:Mechanosensitive ion channel protein n=1 Tax=Ceratocystis pirilliformis TaxID=259994 RepID=A0ABR3YGE0_9PEZI